MNQIIKRIGAVFLFILAMTVVFTGLYRVGSHLGYAAMTKTLTEIDTAQLEQLITDQEEPAIIYLGRESCSYCVRSSGSIRTMLRQNDVLTNGESIGQYYFDTDRHNDQAAQALREAIGVRVVPSVVVLRDGNLSVYEKNFAQLNLNEADNGMQKAEADSHSGLSVAIYGNWCGLNYGDGTPVDYMDMVCMQHTQCLDGPNGVAYCDGMLVQAIKDQLERMVGSQETVAKLYLNYYMLKNW